MKRMSWTLDSYELPDFKIYDTSTHEAQGQVPIAVSNRPSDRTFFIGITPLYDEEDENSSSKLLCYHISDGKYIVVSYNYSSTKLFQDVLSSGIYGDNKTKTAEIDNPDKIPVINSTITEVD